MVELKGDLDTEEGYAIVGKNFDNQLASLTSRKASCTSSTLPLQASSCFSAGLGPDFFPADVNCSVEGVNSSSYAST